MSGDLEASHRRLYSEAQARQLRPGSTMADYIRQHQIIRRQMIQAQYPNISTECTSVLFVFNYVEVHSSYEDAARSIRITGIP